MPTPEPLTAGEDDDLHSMIAAIRGFPELVEAVGLPFDWRGLYVHDTNQLITAIDALMARNAALAAEVKRLWEAADDVTYSMEEYGMVDMAKVRALRDELVCTALPDDEQP